MIQCPAFGEEITEPSAWCENYVGYAFDEVKQLYDTSTPEEKADINSIMGDDDAMKSKADLECHICCTDEKDHARIMNGLKEKFPNAF